MYLHPEMDFCYLRGNHDQCDFLSDLSDDELPENLRQFSEDQWTSYAYGDVVISGLELNRQNSRTLGMDLVLDQTKCNIVVLHGRRQITSPKIRRRWCSCRLSAESISIIWPGPYSLLQKERPGRPGSLLLQRLSGGQGFDECGQKGFVLLNVEDGRVESSLSPPGEAAVS